MRLSSGQVVCSVNGVVKTAKLFPTAVRHRWIHRDLAEELLTRTPTITTTGNREISAPRLPNVWYTTCDVDV